MPTYITLFRWTQQGIENVKESPNRLDAAKEAIRAMGAEMKAFYMVTGQYDLVAVIEAPDDETVAKLVLSTASQGNVQTETLRAFTEDEYRRIIGSLP
ncbi:MAG: GYD domain-containing protein [Candidatus Bipolaricaulia bacterium]